MPTQERKPCSGWGRERGMTSIGVGADRLGLMADALVGPVAIAPVGAGHVLGDSGGPMRAQAAAMAGDPFAAMKDLDCRGGDARLDLLAEQLVRHAVIVLGDLDVVVEADAAALPLGVASVHAGGGVFGWIRSVGLRCG